ncbi:MAG: hypothetical protein HZB53_15760 [Chloroflexi bacterium]|nr:hypothetical protein [Chloroflexota bacterium]
MPGVYPWYEIVEGPELEQGDILFDCPVIELPPELTYPLSEPLDVIVDQLDLIIMTQSCDLVNDKVRDVILCPHWELNDAPRMDPDFARRKALESILKGQRYRYLMIDAHTQPELAALRGIRIVDFGRVINLPKPFVSTLAKQKGQRLRLLPPYREHLSQAFARFFMRVGLPQDIELPK